VSQNFIVISLYCQCRVCVFFFRFIIVSICVILIESARRTQQLELFCEFDDGYAEYSCNARNLQTSYSNRSVSGVSGRHLMGMADEDVGNLFIRMQNCPFLPLNLGDHFPHLLYLGVLKSNVQHLLSGDLDGLDELQHLDLTNNPIEQIGHDFFKDVTKIKFMNFENCHLKRIDATAFDHLTNLVSASFMHNECISFEVHSVSALSVIKRQVEEKCQRSDENLKPIGGKKCIENDRIFSLGVFVIVTIGVLVAILMWICIKFFYFYRKYHSF
jgi:hypothetical protein